MFICNARSNEKIRRLPKICKPSAAARIAWFGLLLELLLSAAEGPDFRILFSVFCFLNSALLQLL
jgi:hypothetical protein